MEQSVQIIQQLKDLMEILVLDARERMDERQRRRDRHGHTDDDEEGQGNE